jgi:serine protease Do
MQFNKRILIAGAAILAVGTVLGAWITARTQSFPFSYAPIPVSAQANPPVSFESGFGAVVQKVTPAVVTVYSTQTVRTGSSTRQPFFNLPDSPFEDFFRQFEDRVPRIRQGLGSGVIISADGYIVTNNHVIDEADEVKVTLQDKREFTAKVVGKDAPSDVAVLKVSASNLPFVEFGDSDSVKVGDIVLAIGNPFGVGQTVTMGIVGAVGRNGLDIEQYEDFIQTDAAINPGNSGGALVNMRGEVIGINAAILTGGARGNQGVGFAIPAKMVASVKDQIIRTGKVTRGWLGVSIQPVTADIAKQFNLPGSPRGALVGDVNEGSPAEKAGLRRGDIITELNGTEVNDSNSLRTRVAALAPGSTAQLKVFREGTERTISVTLGERPGNARISRRGGPSGDGLQLGVTVEPVNPQNRRQFGLNARVSGLVITSVTPGSAAEEAGLRVGDVIQEVNRQTVDDVAQFQRMVRGATGPLLLYVQREGNGFYVTVSPR